MPDMPSCFSARAWVGAIALSLTSCHTLTPPPPDPRPLVIQQNWQLQPGKSIAGYAISGGIGDVSIELAGATIYAPFDGMIQPTHLPACVVFSSPQVPAYLLRLCGLQQPHLGDRRRGDPLGHGRILHLAALRKQPDGTWALVEPSTALIEKTLTPP